MVKFHFFSSNKIIAIRNFIVAISAIVLLPSLAIRCCSQTSSQNFIRKSIFIEKFTSNPCVDYDFARNVVIYYDGLGRPVQRVEQAAGYDVFDIHTITEYDSVGRPYRTWLPIESNGTSGAYLDPEDVKSIAKTFYNDTYPYMETEYERSMESRRAISHNPGAAWRNRNKYENTYRGFNAKGWGDYGCPRFDVSSSGQLVLNNEYDDGMLRYEEVVGEDDNSVIAFYDREDRLLLERCWVSAYEQGKYTECTLDTYYVYNAIGQLVYVIPPKAATILLENGDGACDTEIVCKLCYRYAYDQYNRMIEKQFPGAEPEYYVYDRLDNVVFSQNGNLRKEDKWEVTKFDEKLRKAVVGIATLTGETRTSLQETWGKRVAVESMQTASSYMDQLYYTDTCGISNFEPKESYFYDDYKYFKQITSKELPTDPDYSSGLENATGMLTCKTVWEDWYLIMTSYTYDDRRRTILEHEYNLDGMYNSYTFNKYNFAGDLIRKKTVYNNYDLDLIYTSEYAYEYDYWGTLMSVRHKINDESWTTLYWNNYDEVKRFSGKTIYPRKSPSDSKHSSYRCNLRGWTTSITSPLFSQILYYNDSISGSVPRWGGSPSAMSFTSVNSGGTLDTYTLTYGYDKFDRLASVDSNCSIDNNLLFSESFSYDENGNPLIITRGNINTTPVQYISLSYDGNQIIALNESKQAEGLYPDIPSIAKGDYESGWTYDANGNRTSDPSKGITEITYNYRNQPEEFTFSDGSSLTNLYRSDGTMYGRAERERIISTISNATSASSFLKCISYTFVGDFVIKDCIPIKLNIDGGYIDISPYSATNSTSSYKYYITDHQGSIRAVVDENGALIQATDYSAYGVPSTRFKMESDNHLHLGLEWQPMKGLCGYYNNARFRDALFAGTFYQHDPLAERYYSFSPYHYSANNPLKFKDSTGLAWKPQTNENSDGRQIYIGFVWITPENSYNEDGKLKDGLYEQAIFFSDNGTFDENNDYNMGSSTAIVHTASGKIVEFDANTMPSDSEKYATVPEGLYHATVGKHQGRYSALRLSDTNNSGKIYLEGPNPSDPSRDYCVGINIHKPGAYNKTGMTTTGKAISQGCLLIDIYKWNDFMAIFNTKEQAKNTIGVIIQRK